MKKDLAPFVEFSRTQWAHLRDNMPMPLKESDLQELRGINEHVSIKEVEEIYLPLSRLLNLYVAATQELYRASDRFLHNPTAKVPYVIAIAGSVAVGKSTTARILQALLARWPNHPKVDLVTTDGFLYPNRVLMRNGLMLRKGFPESYDVKKLFQFIADIKSGKRVVTAPIYSHVTYDIVRGQSMRISRPDILILEGLNVLQTSGTRSKKGNPLFLSDFFDFAIYVDAEEKDILKWYVDRFLTLRRTVFRDNASYFHRFSHLSVGEARQMARQIWRTINERNLRENILPTRLRADLILRKGPSHRIRRVYLRKI
jgi:type I pantothenate kinase